MFEDYIQDAYSFYSLGIEAANAGDDRKAKMFFRASIFCAASSIEAFINFVGETLNMAGKLDKNELAFLNDKVIEISSDGIIKEKIKYYPIDGKIKFLIRKFNVPLDIATAPQWAHFLNFKELRDSLIHPKSLSDERLISDYKEIIKKGLNANIDIINAISTTLFQKPLRTNLTDLKL